MRIIPQQQQTFRRQKRVISDKYQQNLFTQPQFGILRWGQHSKYRPLVFTEQGVAMLSSALRSKRAIRVNIAIMRAFVRLRQMVSVNAELAAKLTELERKIEMHDEDIQYRDSPLRQIRRKARESMIPGPSRF